MILPIHALPKTTSDDKLINIFLLVKPGLKALEVESHFTSAERLYSVKIFDENYANLNFTNSKDAFFIEILDLLTNGLLILSLINFLILSLSFENESAKQIVIAKLFGDGFWGLLIRQMIQSLLVIFISLLLITPLMIYLQISSIDFSYLFLKLIMGSLMISTYLANKQHKRSIYDTGNKSYKGIVEPLFVDIVLGSFIAFSFMLIIFNFHVYMQSEEQIFSKISPYEYNEVSAKSGTIKLDSVRIFEQIQLLENEKAELQPSRWTLAYNKHKEFLATFSTITNVLFISTGILFVSIMMFLLDKLKFEISIIRLSGAKIKNVIFYLLKFFIPMLLIATSFSWIMGFFVSSGWVNKFQDKALLNFLPYQLILSFSVTIIILSVGLSSVLISRIPIAKLIKTK